MEHRWVIGVDVGGSSSRARAVSATDSIDVTSAGAAASSVGAGIAILKVLDALVSELEKRGAAGSVAAVGVGATGLGTLADNLGDLRQRVGARVGTTHVALAADAITAHWGALDGRPGVTVAAGTGAITIAETAAGSWHRVDGWGHLLGDSGSASWIGRVALTRAMERHDGRSDTGDELLCAATERLGAPESWPAQLYGRDDRAAILASFAPDVSALGARGDVAATRILREAGAGLARSALAALRRNGVPPELATTGGVFESDIVRASLVTAVAAERPDVTVHAAIGTPLVGAVTLATRVAEDRQGEDVPGLLYWG